MFTPVKDIELPAPLQVHASSMYLYKGDIHVVFFGGTKEKHPDTAIYWAVCKNGEWSEPKIIAKIAPIAHWNPILFAYPNGPLQCYFKVGPTPTDWITYVIKTKDGENWSTPRMLSKRYGVLKPKTLRGPSRNRPVVLNSGTVLAPGSDENEWWRCYIERSTDGGSSWKKSDDIGVRQLTVNIIQPAIWQSSKGVHLLARSDSRVLYRSDSEDDGITWSTPRATSIPNNNSAIDIIKLSSGILIMALNPIGINWGIRTPLSLAYSLNEGDTWLYDQIIDGDGAPLPSVLYGRPYEYHYPCLLEVPDKESPIYCSYTMNRLKIRISKGTLSDAEPRRAWEG